MKVSRREEKAAEGPNDSSKSAIDPHSNSKKFEERRTFRNVIDMRLPNYFYVFYNLLFFGEYLAVRNQTMYYLS